MRPDRASCGVPGCGSRTRDTAETPSDPMRELCPESLSITDQKMAPIHWTVLVYVPAAWAAGVTVAPTKTKSVPVPLKALEVAAADGVNAMPPAVALLAVLW